MPEGKTFSVQPGIDDAHTVVELSPDAWSAFVWELKTCFALLYAEQLTVRQGNFGQMARWEPPLRVGLQRVRSSSTSTIRRRSQTRWTCSIQTFSLDDPPAEIRDFLHRVGFVHLRGVLDAAEIAALTADVGEAVARARPDDRKSWWTTVDGREVCNRVNYLNDGSDRIAALGADPRFVAIAALGEATICEDAHDRLDGNSVVIKVPGIGGRPRRPALASRLRHGRPPGQVPHAQRGDPARCRHGRHRAAPDDPGIAPGHIPASRAHGKPRSIPSWPSTTEPGDVTVHFGHTLHAAPPPTDPDAAGRRALYLSFVPPLTFEMVGPGQGYNDVLFTRSEGHVQHVDQFR